MKALYDKISADCSSNITANYSTSFNWAVKMLSAKIRGDVHNIYGFVRLADEIVDTFHDYDKQVLLDEFENDLKNALTRRISTNPVLNSFQNTVHKYNIDLDLIEAFMKSMRADLTKQTYQTAEEYKEYIYGSADVVGLMCLKIFVGGDQAKYDELKEPAMKLGSAFQKVNFLRDMKDDTEELNRTYFPEIANHRFDEKTKEKIIREIENDFEEASIGVSKLPMEAKFGVYTAFIFYKKLLKKLKKVNAEQIRVKRVRISNTMKFYLLLKSFFSYRFKLV